MSHEKAISDQINQMELPNFAVETPCFVILEDAVSK